MRLSYLFLSTSLLISLIIGVIVYNYIDFYNIIGFDKALEGVLLFASISMGFYTASISIIASIFNTKVVKEIMKERDDKREFIIVVVSTLLVGFLTVFITILYQVFLSNGEIPIKYLKITNLVWSSLVMMYFFVNVIFILIAFLIFFNNTDYDETKIESVYTPPLKKEK